MDSLVVSSLLNLCASCRHWITTKLRSKSCWTGPSGPRASTSTTSKALGMIAPMRVPSIDLQRGSQLESTDLHLVTIFFSLCDKEQYKRFWNTCPKQVCLKQSCLGRSFEQSWSVPGFALPTMTLEIQWVSQVQMLSKETHIVDKKAKQILKVIPWARYPRLLRLIRLGVAIQLSCCDIHLRNLQEPIQSILKTSAKAGNQILDECGILREQQTTIVFVGAKRQGDQCVAEKPPAKPAFWELNIVHLMKKPMTVY